MTTLRVSVEDPPGKRLRSRGSHRGPRHRTAAFSRFGGSAGNAAGFTLMEMLVTLVLVSFTTMLMFQMLGSYRLAHERVQGQSGVIDRQALFQSWFQDSVRGLYITNGMTFAGSADEFRGTTLNPLYGEAGSPTPVAWQLRIEGDVRWIAYAEDGRERWRRPLSGAERARFVYMDVAGKALDRGPPKLGGEEEGVPTLPAQVALVREGGGVLHTIVGAVRGPLRPVLRSTGQQEDF